LEKGVWRFEIALGLFFEFFGRRQSLEKESGDLRLLERYLKK